MKWARHPLVWAIAAIASAPGPAVACSCLPPPPQRALAAADAVFVGTVVNRTPTPWRVTDGRTWDGFAVEFVVAEWWKGGGDRQAIVVTGEGRGDCGVPFEVGQAYLVFAYLDDAGRLSTNICTGTGSLAGSVPTIRELERDRVARQWRTSTWVVALAALAIGVVIGRTFRRRESSGIAPGAVPAPGTGRDNG